MKNFTNTCLLIGLVAFLSIQPSFAQQGGLYDSLVAYYPFSGDATDHSGLGHDGTVHGGASLTTDRNGLQNAAYNFDGSGGYIDGVNADLPVGDAPRTISLWVRPLTPHNDNGGQMLINWGTPTTGNHSQVYLKNLPNVVRFSNFGTSINANYTYTAGDWVHIACTYENGQSKLYINGVESATGLITFNTVGMGFDIGRINPGLSFSGYFNGDIDEIYIHSRVLDPMEINIIKDQGLPPVSIEKQNFHLNVLHISPNPSNGKVKIETDYNGQGFIQMINMEGRLSGSFLLKKEYDFSSFARGVYQMVLKDMEGNSLASKKIILR